LGIRGGKAFKLSCDINHRDPGRRCCGGRHSLRGGSRLRGRSGLRGGTIETELLKDCAKQAHGRSFLLEMLV
jgi:hypothetical protein